MISGTVKEGMSCHRISTRLDVEEAEACEAFTKATKENRFFNTLDKNEKLISATYKFRDFPNRIKVKKTFEFDSHDNCN